MVSEYSRQLFRERYGFHDITLDALMQYQSHYHLFMGPELGNADRASRYHTRIIITQLLMVMDFETSLTPHACSTIEGSDRIETNCTGVAPILLILT